MFFEDKRVNFFRPLANSYRNEVLACLSDFYLRTHGARADYGSRYTRETLRERFQEVVAEHLPDDANRSAKDIAAHILGELLDCGWLVTPIDAATRVEIVQFTRPGKQVAGLLARFETPRLATRSRNLRVCANSLAAYQAHSDPDDLLEAYNAGQQVIHDLTDLIEQVREATRALLSGAHSLEAVVPDMLAFLDLFDREIRPHLTVDSIDRYRHRILTFIETLRLTPPDKVEAEEAELNQVEPRLVALRDGDSSRQWLLERIEDMVVAAVSAMRPELFEALHTYQLRHQRLVRQGMSMRTASRESLTGKIDGMSHEKLEQLVVVLMGGLHTSKVRLPDETSLATGLKMLAAMTSRQQVPLTVKEAEIPLAEKEGAHVRNSVTRSYALPVESLRTKLDSLLKTEPSVRVSQLQPEKMTFMSLQELMAWAGVAQSLGCVLRVENKRWSNEYVTSDELVIERNGARR